MWECDIDETQQDLPDEPGVDAPRNIRAELLSLWSIVELGRQYFIQKKLRHALIYVRYQHLHPGRRKREPMDVEKQVERWVEIVAGMSTAHSREEIDRTEYDIDAALAPILTAPVKQLREFWGKLVKRLEADKRIPYFVWSVFVAYGEVIIEKATKDEVVELKTKLAREIAEMVEKEVAIDLPAAIAGALQWRPPEALERMKTEVQKKDRPRAKLTGKESCLFLDVGNERMML